MSKAVDYLRKASGNQGQHFMCCALALDRAADEVEKLEQSSHDRAALVERLEQAVISPSGDAFDDDLILIPRWLVREAAAALRGETE